MSENLQSEFLSIKIYRIFPGRSVVSHGKHHDAAPTRIRDSHAQFHGIFSALQGRARRR